LFFCVNPAKILGCVVCRPGAKGGAWIPGAFTPTEHWAALVNEHGWGLGVVNFGSQTWLGGFSGDKGSGGSSDSPTG
jgi:hypothetical protein